MTWSPMMRRSGQMALLVTYAAVALLVVFSNHYDWDAFDTFAEVERRTWLVEHEPPVWTYQLCAGMSRIGDPQAFGLSPLFVLVLGFGSFWGGKIWVLVVLAMGIFFTAQIFVRFHAVDPCGGGSRQPYVVLATLFVFGNYFLWHLLVGHFTFTEVLVGLGIIHYTLKGHDEGLTRRDFVLGALVTWQHYSGGFFHSLVYLLFPFFVAFVAFVAIEQILVATRRRASARPLRARLAHAIGFHVLGIGLAGYKLRAVWEYSHGIRRTLTSPSEFLSVGEVLSHHLMPTWHLRWLVPQNLGNLWQVHEYSAFTLLAPLCVVAAGFAYFDRTAAGTRAPPAHPLALFQGIYLVVAVLFAMGDYSPYAPFSLANRVLWNDSVRIIGRFQVGVALAFGMGLLLLVRHPGRARLIGPRACLALLVGLDVNLLTFLPLTSASRLRELLALPSTPNPRMRGWARIQLYPPGRRDIGYELSLVNTSQMYPWALRGQGIDNCYNALPRSQAPERGPGPWLPLVASEGGLPTSACVEESYYTQGRVVLGEHCTELTCTNVARINPGQGEPLLTRLTHDDRYCARRPASR